jgi:hypothetical protein
MPLSSLGTYWLYKLPDVSFRDTLRSCLEGKPFGALPAHGTFLYPKHHGYGELWNRIGAALGDRLLTSVPVSKIDLTTLTVNDRYKAKTIISTIPWTLWPKIADVPAEIQSQILKLVHIPIDVDYQPENIPTDSHWTYEPREDISYHRILVRHNFCPGAKGYWTETNSARNKSPQHFRHRNEFAYPVNTRAKPEAIKAILAWATTHNVIGAGRWGTWEHMNSDIAVHEAMLLAEKLIN